MAELRGVGIGLGVAQGPVARMAEPLPAPGDGASERSVEDETTRVREAVGVVARELEQRGAQAGGAAQDVLEAQAMMAEDPSLESEIDARIAAGKTAEFAVHDAFASFRDTLTAMGGYLGERAADLDDVAQRVIARLRGVPAPGVPDPGYPFVLVAKDLAPADTALLDLDKVLALVTTEGGPTSHTAILGKPEGAVDAVALGAEGVGLFRTEFLFLSANQAPTVEQQRESYTQLLNAFPGKKVVVRVLDAGADKPLAFLNDAHEENPALGLRGIRALRASEDILREQLTALAQADAATDADLWVMAPMVATVEETEYFVELARDYGIKTAGVMVEVPSSALLADRILSYT